MTAGLPEASFDVITSFEVIEHVPQPLDFATTFVKLLKPGGVAILSTPNGASTIKNGTLSDPTHLREFLPNEFEAVLKQAGFEQVKMYGQHFHEAIWEMHHTRARLGKLDAFGLRHLIPGRMKAQILRLLSPQKNATSPTQSATSDSSEPKFVLSTPAVSISHDLGGAYVQMAVCHK